MASSDPDPNPNTLSPSHEGKAAKRGKGNIKQDPLLHAKMLESSNNDWLQEKINNMLQGGSEYEADKKILCSLSLQYPNALILKLTELLQLHPRQLTERTQIALLLRNTTRFCPANDALLEQSNDARSTSSLFPAT